MLQPAVGMKSCLCAVLLLGAGSLLWGSESPQRLAGESAGPLPRWLEAQRAEFPDLKWVDRVYAAQPFAHSRRISAVAFGPNDETIITASGEGIHEWSYPQGEPLRNIPLDCLNDADLCLSADRRWLVICSDKGDVRLLKLPSWDNVRQVATADEFNLQGTYLCDMAISPDGGTIALGYRRWGWTTPIGDGTGLPNAPSNVTEGGLAVYDHTGRTDHLEEVGGAVVAVAFDSKGRRLAAARMDGQIMLIAPDFTSGGDFLHVPMSHTSESPVGLAFDGDGARLAILTSHGSVSLWNVDDGRNLWTHSGPHSGRGMIWSGSPGEVVFGANEEQVIASSWLAAQELVFDTRTGKPSGNPASVLSGGQRLALTRDGDVIASVRGPRVRLLDGSTLQPIDGGKEEVDLTGVEGGEVLVSPEGRYFVTHTQTAIVLWDLESGRSLQRIVPGGIVRFTPDGGHLVVARNGEFVPGHGRRVGSVAMYDVPAFGTVRTWELPDGLCEDLEVTPDGERMVVCGRREVWVYSLLDGAPLRSISPDLNSGTGTDPDWLSGVSISPDGRLAAICVDLQGIIRREPVNDSCRRTIHVHSLETGERTSLILSPGDPHSYEFSSDVRRLVVAGTQGITTVGMPPFPDAVIYDVQSGNELQRLVGDQGSNGVWRMWTDTPRDLAFISRTGLLRAWDTRTGQRLWDLRFPGVIRSIAQVPGSTHVLIGRSDGSIWRVRYPDGNN